MAPLHTAPRPAHPSPPRRWGALIQREVAALAPLLLSGCSSPPPAAAPPPPPPVASAPAPEPAPAGPAADPPGAALGVGPFVPLVAPLADDSSYQHNVVSYGIPFGGGVFSVYEFEHERGEGVPSCAVKTPFPDACTSFSFAPWRDGEGRSRWPRLPEDKFTEEGNGKLHPSPTRWSRYSPGKEGIYAVRPGDPFQIDFIRPDGKIEVFFSDPKNEYSDAVVVETRGGGHAAVLRLAPRAAEGRGYQSVGPLVVGTFSQGKGGRQLKITQKLDIGDTWLDARSSDARDAIKIAKRAGYGPFRLVPLLDRKGGLSGELALVWVEAFPPAGFEPEPEEAPKKKTKKKAKKKAKNQCGQPDRSHFLERLEARFSFMEGGCGGRMSRPLSSPDVRKRLHITRIDAEGKVKGDHAEALSDEYDAEKRALVVRPTEGGGLSVDRRVYDASFKRLEDLPSRGFSSEFSAGLSFAGSAPQRLISAHFDAASGEALVVMREARYMMFNGKQQDDTTYLRRLSALGEPLGTATAAPELDGFPEPVAVVKVRDGWFVSAPSSIPPSFRVVGGAHHGAFHPVPHKVEGCEEQAMLKSLLPAPGGEARMILTCKDRHASTLLSSQSLLASPLTEVETLPDEPHQNVVDVWGDRVTLVEAKGKTSAVWQRADQSVDLDPKTIEPSERTSRVRLMAAPSPGPVLDNHRFLLPSAPGQPIAAPKELTQALDFCPVALPTGPRRLLLVCAEPASDSQPNVLVGTRVARY